MEKLRKVLQYIIQQHNQSKIDPNVKDIKLLGSGGFSVVFDFGEGVFKLTTEANLQHYKNSFDKINILAEQGVNCPKTYVVEEYNIDCNKKVFIDKLLLNVGFEKEFYGTLSRVSQMKEGDFDVLTGIFQEKIEGITYLNHFGQMEEFYDFIINVPEEQLYKFVLDANKLIKKGVKIDSLNSSNFLYNEDKGFYFIDLDGGAYSNTNPFDCTLGKIINRHRAINRSVIRKQNADEFKKSFNVYCKLYDISKKLYLGNLNDDYLKEKGREFLYGYFYNNYLFWLSSELSNIEDISDEDKKVIVKKIKSLKSEMDKGLEEMEMTTYYPQIKD